MPQCIPTQYNNNNNNDNNNNKKDLPAQHQWLTPAILTTQEAEIRRIVL
jgi:hypothetical protein